MLSATAWLIGGTGLITMVISIIFGLFFIYKAKKLDAKLLYLTGLLIISTGLLYLGASATFLCMLFTGKNIPNETGVHGLLSFTSIAPGIVCGMYLGSELLAPKKKKIIVGIYAIIAVVFEIILYICPRCALKFTNEDSSTDLIDSSFVLLYPTFIFVVVFLISILVFCGIGSLIKAQQASGDLKKKFRFLSLGFTIFVISGALDALVAPGIWLIFIRLGMITYAWLLYFGLKPAKIS